MSNIFGQDTSGSTSNLEELENPIIPSLDDNITLGTNDKRFSEAHIADAYIDSLTVSSLDTTDKLILLGYNSIDSSNRGITMQHDTNYFSGIIKGSDETFHLYTNSLVQPSIVTDPNTLTKADLKCANINSGAITATQAIVDQVDINNSQITFSGPDQQNIISFPDNTAIALKFAEGGNDYMAFSSDDIAPQIDVYQNLILNGANVIGNESMELDGPTSTIYCRDYDCPNTETVVNIAKTYGQNINIGQVATGSTTVNNDLLVSGDVHLNNIVSKLGTTINIGNSITQTLNLSTAGDSTNVNLSKSGAQTTVFGNLDVNEGLDITGDITLTGLVDNRDIALDGAQTDTNTLDISSILNTMVVSGGYGNPAFKDSDNTYTANGLAVDYDNNLVFGVGGATDLNIYFYNQDTLQLTYINNIGGLTGTSTKCCVNHYDVNKYVFVAAGGNLHSVLYSTDGLTLTLKDSKGTFTYNDIIWDQVNNCMWGFLNANGFVKINCDNTTGLLSENLAISTYHCSSGTVYAGGSRLAVCGNNGVVIYNISNPNAPVQITSPPVTLSTASKYVGVQEDSNLMWVSGATQRLKTFDITNEVTPVAIQELTAIGNTAEQLWVSPSLENGKKYCYIALSGTGLTIYELQGSTMVQIYQDTDANHQPANGVVVVPPDSNALFVAGGAKGVLSYQQRNDATFNCVTVSCTNESTDDVSGALIVSGGIGCAKNLNIGGSLGLYGSTSGKLSLSSNPTTTDYNLIMPPAQGSSNQSLINDGFGNLTWGTAGLTAFENKTFSTGVLQGGLLTVNGGDNTKFDISDGNGIIVDSLGVKTNIVWSGLTAQSTTYVGILTYVSINSLGQPVYSPSKPTNSEIRDNVFLGVLVHVNGVNIDTTNDQQMTVLNSTNQLRDLTQALGFINVSGNVLSPVTLLTFQKSAGSMFAYGSNFKNDPKNPHLLSLPAVDTSGAGIFQYRNQDGTSSALTLKNIIPNVYDDGNPYNGTSPLVPNNKYTIQRFYSFTSNNIKVQMGQNIYDSMEQARNAINTESFVTEPSIAENGMLIGFLIVKNTTTDLNNSADAKFILAGKLGSLGGVTGSSGNELLQNGNSFSTTLIFGTNDAESVSVKTDNIVKMTWTDGETNTAYPIKITNTTQSTSVSTGALTCDGGLGMDGNLYVGGNIVLTGDLTVNGTQTVLNTNTVQVEDSIIEIANNNSSDIINSGWISQYNDGLDKWTGLLRAYASSDYYLIEDTTTKPTNTTSLTPLTRSRLNVSNIITDAGTQYQTSVSVGNNSTGIYSSSVFQLDFVTNSLPSFSINSNQDIIVAPGKQLLTDNGTALDPSLCVGDLNTGLHSSGTGISRSLYLNTGGVSRLTLSNSNALFSIPVIATSGSQTIPSISFGVDADTGFYDNAENILSVTTGGSQCSNWDASGHFNMLGQREVRFQDSAGGQYVGFKAPITVGTSYSLTLPSTNTSGLLRNTGGVLSYDSSNYIVNGGQFDVITIGSTAPQSMYFITDATSRVEIDSTGNFNILNEKEIRFQDNTGGQYVGFKAPNTVSSSYSLTLPSTNNNGFLSNTGGVLSFVSGSTGDVINGGQPGDLIIGTTNPATNLTFITNNLNRVQIDSIGNFNIYNEKEIRFQDNTGGEYVGFKAPTTVSSSYSLTYPNANGNRSESMLLDGMGNFVFSKASKDFNGQINFTNATSAGTDSRSIVWVPYLKMFIVGFNGVAGSRIQTSNDGKNWTTRTTPANSEYCYDFAYDSQNIIGVGYSLSPTTTNNVISSSDGITWTARTLPVAGVIESIDYSSSLGANGRFVIVGTNSCYTSDDAGITWTSRTSANGNRIFKVVWVCWLNKFVAVSDKSVSINNIHSSSDGITWSAISHIANLTCLGLSEELELLVMSDTTSGNIYTSNDAVTWTPRTISAGNPRCITYAKKHFYIMDGGTPSTGYWYSSDGIFWILKSGGTFRKDKLEYSPLLDRFVVTEITGTSNPLHYGEAVDLAPIDQQLNSESNVSFGSVSLKPQEQFERVNPKIGEMIYNKNTKKMNFWDGSAWRVITST